MAGSFIGREDELARILDLVQEVVAGTGPVAAVVHGDPGSGKSHLLAEVDARAALDEQIVLAGYEPEASIPLATARGLFRRLTAVPGSAGSVEALLFDPASATGPVEPIRLFEATHRALAAIGPVLLAVDDLQWADELSLGLLHYLVRAAEAAGLPLAMVAASRPAASSRSLWDSLGRVVADPRRLALIELGPLDREAGTRLVLELAPSLGPTRAAELWRRAGGSPFWMRQLAAGLPVADMASLVAARAEKAGTDAGALLMTLALAGRPVAPEEAARLQGWPAGRLEAAWAGLVAEGLAADLGGTLRVTHDLIREFVAASVPPEVAPRLHRRVAAWLEELAGDDAPLLLEALDHRRQGSMPALDLALRLARSPRRRLLGTEGAGRLAAIADAADPANSATGELQRHVAALTAELGEHEVALARWAALAAGPGGRSGTALAALAASESALQLGRRREAWQWLARAREAGVDDPAVQVESDAQESALHRYLERRPEESRAAARRAVTAARAASDRAGGIGAVAEPARRTYLRALLAGTEAALEANDLEEMLALSEELTTAAVGVDDRIRLRAVGEGALALRLLGRNREAEARLRQAWEEARRLVLPQATLETGATYAVVLRSLGRLEEAEAVVEECLDLGRRMEEFSPARAFNVVVPHLVALSKGDWSSAVEGLRAAAGQEPEPHYRLHAHLERASALARVDPRHAGADVAAGVADALADAERAGCRRCLAETTFRGAEAMARIGRWGDARRLLGRPAPVDPGGTGYLAWCRSLALASLERGDHDAVRSAASLESVAAEAGRQGLLLEAVWIGVDLGALLASADPPRASQVLREAGAEAERMRAVTETRLAEQGLRALGVRTWRRGRRAAGAGSLAELSQREREIAERVASGASNPEIAAALFLSRKTVERHVSNVLAKLGIRNRAELAAVLGHPARSKVGGAPR